MKSKDRQHTDAAQGHPEVGRPEVGRPEVGRPEVGRPDSGRLDAAVPLQLPPSYLDRISTLVGQSMSIDRSLSKPLFFLAAPGVDCRALTTAVLDRLQYAYQAFDCLADGCPDFERHSASEEVNDSIILILHAECLSVDELAILLSRVTTPGSGRYVIASSRPLWFALRQSEAVDCDVLGPSELRYSKEDLQYLLEKQMPAVSDAGDYSSNFDRHDLLAMTQGWPGISEYALVDLSRSSAPDGLRFLPLAKLDSVKQHFMRSWLPAMDARYRWLLEVSNLPLLNLDLLGSLYADLGTMVQECLALEWLEPCPKNAGFYQINAVLDVLVLSVWSELKNEDVLQRAADWYQRNGYLAEAVECLVSFVDSERVLSILSDEGLRQAGHKGGSEVAFRSAKFLRNVEASANVAKDSLKHATSEGISPMAKAIVANVEKSDRSFKQAAVNRRSASANVLSGANSRSGGSLPAVDAVGHILTAFNYHQDKDAEAVSLAITEALDAGIDRKYLSAVMDFMDMHIRPLLRSDSGPLQLALRDLKHSAPAREVVSAHSQQLNHRELQVLQRICEGYKNKEISEQLGLELSTIKWYSTGIYEKLQVRNRTQAVAKAQALKLFE